MDPTHAFDSKRAQGTLCSCGHARADHVERYQPGKPLKNVCRRCAEG
jgi:hypothetical protein